jgi:hypothetical protein
MAHTNPSAGEGFGVAMFFAHEKPFVLFRTIRLTVGLTLLLAANAGCGEMKGRVSGQVSFNGSPLPAGKITFICEGGNKPVLSADIREGKYEIKEVPVGSVKITVATYKPSGTVERPHGLGPTKRPGTDNTPPAPPQEYVAIPPHYGQPDRSNLAYDVKAGDQEHDIRLTP